MHYQSAITNFMLTGKQEVPRYPTVPDEKTRLLRARIIFEEALEQVEALGCDVALDRFGNRSVLSNDDISFRITGNIDLAAIADGCIDQCYVSIGTLCSLGINADDIFRIVHHANMEKFRDGVKLRPDGKIIKPLGWVPPDDEIRREITRQAKEGNGLT
jgi:predicted HAD superfamily Cof-like phosphohydrolase